MKTEVLEKANKYSALLSRVEQAIRRIADDSVKIGDTYFSNDEKIFTPILKKAMKEVLKVGKERLQDRFNRLNDDTLAQIEAEEKAELETEEEKEARLARKNF